MKHDLHPDPLEQQFILDANPRYAGQLLEGSQKRLSRHSLSESQSPSSAAQGLADVQKCSSPTIGA